MGTAEHYDLTLQVQLETDFDLPEARILGAVAWVLGAHDVATGMGMSLVIMDDAGIQRLNQQFRAIDRPTDVLSFVADPSPALNDEPYLGDLVLALPYIRRQAAADGHNPSDELVLAAIHGTLHLLGYDHDTPDHQAVMWTAQASALKAMGITIEVPLFEFPDDVQEGD